MNLVKDPWISVLALDGKHRSVSLRESFAEGDKIADLALNPCQRIAVMRLLICIAQAALDGPADETAWAACRPRLRDAALAYLDKWRPRFELFGEDAFLQVDGIEMPEEIEDQKPLSTLDILSASGRSGQSSLWDHAVGHDFGKAQEPAGTAMNLLCCHCFSTSGRVGKANWQGTTYVKSAGVSPCHNYLHTFILGDNLSDSIYLNLVSKKTVASSVVFDGEDRWGRPIWENMPAGPNDDLGILRAARTYLGRLVPLSRLTRIVQHKDVSWCVHGPPPDKLKMERLPFFREPSATVILGRDGSEHYIRVAPERHAWRELEAILTITRASSPRVGGPLAFYRMTSLATRKGYSTIWVGGSAKGDEECKVDDMVDWRIPVPNALIGSTLLATYASGVDFANDGESRLQAGIKEYRKERVRIKSRGSADSIHSEASPDLARTLYWSALDRNCRILADTAADPAASLDTAWLPRICAAMHAAYERACPHETPRQIQAYAFGLRHLRMRPADRRADSLRTQEKPE